MFLCAGLIFTESFGIVQADHLRWHLWHSCSRAQPRKLRPPRVLAVTADMLMVCLTIGWKRFHIFLKSFLLTWKYSETLWEKVVVKCAKYSATNSQKEINCCWQVNSRLLSDSELPGLKTLELLFNSLFSSGLLSTAVTSFVTEGYDTLSCSEQSVQHWFAFPLSTQPCREGLRTQQGWKTSQTHLQQTRDAFILKELSENAQ